MLLTETQAAKEAQVDKRTLRKLILLGRLRALDFGSGKRHRFRIDSMDLYNVTSEPTLTCSASLPRLSSPRRGRAVPVLTLQAFLPSV